MGMKRIVNVGIDPDLHREMKRYTDSIGLKMRALPGILWRAFQELPSDRQREIVLAGLAPHRKNSQPKQRKPAHSAA